MRTPGPPLDDQIPTGVCDPVPAYRQGLIVALANAGFDAEAIQDPEAWAATEGRRVVLLTASLPEDSETIKKLTGVNSELSIVVLLQDASAPAYQGALAAGASGAVPWDENPEAVIEVLRAVLEDYCLLPTGVARALAMANGSSLGVPTITDWEKQWLQMLANGVTIAELAREASYSEREMFRLLHRLYERLGARNRIEALVRAARAGLLD